MVERTAEARSEFSKFQITLAKMSIWPRNTPRQAQVGAACRELCQDLPIGRIADCRKFADIAVT